MKKWQPLFFVATLCLAAATAHAGTTTVPDSDLSSSPGVYTAGGYFTDSLGSVVVTTGGGNAADVGEADGRNDDGFSGPITLPFSINLFGTTSNQIFINNNGNISLGAGISDFTPTGPTGADEPIISPFFADVDTRNPLSGVVHYNQVSATQVVITWDAVGYYSENANLLDSFQLVLNDPNAVPAGEGSIGFFYQTMQWETGDASGGSNGFGGDPAAVGFGDGAGDAEVLAGSLDNGISGIVNDEYIWFNTTACPPGTEGANCAPIPVNPGNPVPEPSSFLLLGIGVASLIAFRKRDLLSNLA